MYRGSDFLSFVEEKLDNNAKILLTPVQRLLRSTVAFLDREMGHLSLWSSKTRLFSCTSLVGQSRKDRGCRRPWSLGRRPVVTVRVGTPATGGRGSSTADGVKAWVRRRTGVGVVEGPPSVYLPNYYVRRPDWSIGDSVDSD